MDKNFRVYLCYSLHPRQIYEETLYLWAGACVEDLLKTSPSFQHNFQNILLEDLLVGIWGRKCSLQQKLYPEDRVEIYRPLRVDPKIARRLRFAGQGKAKTAGLFVSRRPPGGNQSGMV
jgi:putative ubiquitin-RnfH superfamily antitoxin RatB of RatAB toxin-antitoxin module